MLSLELGDNSEKVFEDEIFPSSFLSSRLIPFGFLLGVCYLNISIPVLHVLALVVMEDGTCQYFISIESIVSFV